MTNSIQDPRDEKIAQPELLGYTVIDRGGEKRVVWTRIAAGWPHKDGRGYDIRFDALPVDGRLTLRFQDKSDVSAEKQMPREYPAPV